MKTTIFNMTKCVISVDMGGTYIKYGVVSSTGEILHSGKTPAKSSDSREVLLNRLCGAIGELFCASKDNGYRICGIAVSTPGPFDYAAGKSGMKGKYDSIFGIDLREEFRTRANLPHDMPIEFMQDAAAFLLGEYYGGAARGVDNCACVTIGTGLGYACMLDGKILLNERGGPYFVLAFSPYRDTDKRMEDIVSGTAILKNYGLDAKTLADKAYAGDREAIAAYNKMGAALGEALKQIPEIKGVAKIIIGGQIARSFDLMEEALYNSIGLSVVFCEAEYPEGAALIGAASRIFNFKV